MDPFQRGHWSGDRRAMYRSDPFRFLVLSFRRIDIGVRRVEEEVMEGCCNNHPLGTQGHFLTLNLSDCHF